MTTIELDSRPKPVSFESLGSGGPERPVPVALPSENVQVLRGIRALLAFCAFMLAAVTMIMVAAAMGALDGGRGLTMVTAPVSLQLLQPGPDPAVDYYAHAVFADGTERDLPLGGFIVHNGLVRVELGVTAEQGSESACRIVIDGIAVTEERATDGGSTVCRWEAS